MISKLDQLFAENLHWIMLTIFILAVLLAIEEIWRPARRLMKWATSPIPSPSCINCGSENTKPTGQFDEKIFQAVMSSMLMSGRTSAEHPYVPREYTCGDCQGTFNA